MIKLSLGIFQIYLSPHQQ